MNLPLVSIVIPFYNNKNWLDEAISSVIYQNYPNKEVFVINDGSKEDIEDLESKYNNLVTFIFQENAGPATARNKGIDLSTGKYVAFLDSDDIWEKEKLIKQVLLMEKENLVWSHHSYEMFWDNNQKKIIDTEKHKGDIYIDIFISLKIQTSCIMVLRDVIIKESIYFPKDKRYGQDIEFYKTLAKKYEIGYLNGIYSKFRINGNNAGFRAKVQLLNKAETFLEIKENTHLRNILGNKIYFGYQLAFLNSKILKFVENKITKNEKTLELLSKLLYISPYAFIKFINGKKNK